MNSELLGCSGRGNDKDRYVASLDVMRDIADWDKERGKFLYTYDYINSLTKESGNE